MTDTDVIEEEKFSDPDWTAKGNKRAHIQPKTLHTLWLNTGTLCNIECENCYIESSPRNDRLQFLEPDEVRTYLDEIERENLDTREIGVTGGEPFVNPDIMVILEECLRRDYDVLVLTNAMQPMKNHREDLLELHRASGENLTLRVSLDHYKKEYHEAERGAGTWSDTLEGLKWLSSHDVSIAVAGRTRWEEEPEEARSGYAALFRKKGIEIDAEDPDQLVLFPEMKEDGDVPEITENCWEKVGTDPDEIMCSSSRMVVKFRGEDRPVVQACTLIPYDRNFSLGHTLKESLQPVPLNHRNCAQFCVLGGGSCS